MKKDYFRPYPVVIFLLLGILSKVCHLSLFRIYRPGGGQPRGASAGSIKIVALNCCGLARATAIRGVGGLIRSHKPNIVILSETKIKVKFSRL